MDKERALSNKELRKHGKNLGGSEHGDKMKEQENSSRKKESEIGNRREHQRIIWNEDVLKDVMGERIVDEKEEKLEGKVQLVEQMSDKREEGLEEGHDNKMERDGKE